MQTNLHRIFTLYYVVFYVYICNCYSIYVSVFVYCKTFMLYKTFDKQPIYENFDHPISIQIELVQSLNGSWHLITLLARTKASLICLVRSQQLCRGTMRIRLASKSCSYGNRSLRLSYDINKVSRSLMSLCQAIVDQSCDTVAWHREIRFINIYLYLLMSGMVTVPQGVSLIPFRMSVPTGIVILLLKCL